MKNQDCGGLLSRRASRGGQRCLSAPKTSIRFQRNMHMKSLSTIVAGSAASVLMLNGLAFAQQQSQPQQQYQQNQTQQLTSREVRQFMSEIEREINQMVQTGNLSRLSQWTQNHVADNAVFSRTNSIETDGRSRAIASMTITKPDLLRLQRFVLSGMSERLNSAEDFQLDMQVVNVRPVGDSAAIVKSHISERATLAPRQAESGGHMRRQRESTTGQGPGTQEDEDLGDQQQRGQPHSRQSGHGQQAAVQLESRAVCTFLIERNRDAGRLQIALGICDGQTDAQL
jgi:hypothetical protein